MLKTVAEVKLVVRIAFASAAAFLCSAANPPDLLRAQQLADSGRWTEAETAARAVISVHPDSAAAHTLLGYVLFKEDKPEASLAEYAQAAKLTPPGASDLSIIGSDYFLLEDYVAADKWLSQSVQKAPPSAFTLYVLARSKYNERLFADALPLFARCLQLDPRDPKAQEYLGLSYQHLGNTDQAIAALRTAVSLSEASGTFDAAPYLNLGSLLLENDRPAEAVPYLSRAANLEPKSALAHRELGKAYLQLSQLTQARAQVETAVALDPQSAPAHFLLAEIYRKLNLPDKARSETATYSALSGTHSAPDDPLSEARSLVTLGKLDQASDTVARYLALHKNSADAHYLRGYILFKQQRAKASLAEYTEGAKYRVPTANDLAVVAADYVLLHDYLDADKWFTKASQWDPANVQTLYYLGRTKYNENRFEEAAAIFRRCLALRPKDVKAEDNLGLSYQGLGRMQDALLAFRTAIEWQAAATLKDSGPYIDLGSLLVDQGQPAEALPYLRQALAISPRDMRAHRELAKAYIHLSDFSKALPELETSAQLAPANAPVHFMLAQVYRKLGKDKEAEEEVERYKALAASHSTDE
jgi:tetratricopeptide (TPR) repeat protein